MGRSGEPAKPEASTPGLFSGPVAGVMRYVAAKRGGIPRLGRPGRAYTGSGLRAPGGGAHALGASGGGGAVPAWLGRGGEPGGYAGACEGEAKNRISVGGINPQRTAIFMTVGS